MDKPTVMSELNIQIALLFILSTSLSTLLYMIYLEYSRQKYLNSIKKMLSKSSHEDQNILSNKKQKGTKSLKNKIESIMLLAGLKFPIILFIAIFILFISLFCSFFTLFLQHISGVVFGAFFGFLIFYMIVKALILRRKKEFNSALASAISVLVKMMKNGVGFEQAIAKSIDISNSKVFKELFSQFFKEKNTVGEEEAFSNLNKYVNSKELQIFALAVKIGRESGGKFSNTLEKVEETIQYRKKMQQKIDVVTREGSIGSYVVASIAVFLYFALDLNFDGRLHNYYMTSEYGRFQILAIFLWVFLGLIANKFITRVEK